MRFIAGRTLAEAIKSFHSHRKQGTTAPLELAGLLDAFVAVCRTVAFAHSRNIIHRDLKGQNIILGDFGEVFLLDWGLGKHVEEVDGDIATTDFAPLSDASANGSSDRLMTAVMPACGVKRFSKASTAINLSALAATSWSMR